MKTTATTNLLFAWAVGLLSCVSATITTVNTLDVPKYLGRWYQLYGNEFTSMIISRDSTCIAADYGLDEVSGNITVINSDREHCPTGELNTITGYAYGTGEENPGQLKVHLGQVPVDGDYWIAALGPETYGPDELYEWAIVTGPEAVTLFVLVRDVKKFEKKFACEVLELVESLGFTGPMKEPVRIVQEGCLPFVPPTATDSSESSSSTLRGAGGVTRRCSSSNHKYSSLSDERKASLQQFATFPTPTALIHGEVPSEAATSELEFAFVVDALADKKSAIVTEAINDFASLNIHMTQTERWSLMSEYVKALVQEVTAWEEHMKAKMDMVNAPVETVDALDVDRYTGRWYQAYASFTVATLLEQKGACVTADYKLNDDSTIAVTNTARAKSVDGALVEMKGYAYGVDESQPGQLMVHLDDVPVDGPYWVLALGDKDGSKPYPWAIVSDPVRAFLFVLVRDPDTFYGSDQEKEVLQLCKDLGFTSFWNLPRKTVQEGCTYTAATAAAAAVTEDLTEDVTEDGDAEKVVSPVFAIRGGGGGEGDGDGVPSGAGVKNAWFGGGPLHASCKLSWTFPNDNCAAVKDKLVAAAKSMNGFDKCNGGNKCGYSVVGMQVQPAADQSNNFVVEMVHETSVKHYKDDLTITLSKKKDSCTAQGFSTSQTWYAVLDNSVNYCNLHNLVEASGLEFTESDVSDKTCTQYSSADCERY